MLDNTNNWKDKMQALKEHASPIDLPLEWDALENRMEKRKRRRFVFWIWPVILGIGMISGHILTLNRKQIESPVNKLESKPKVAVVQQNTSIIEANTNSHNEHLKNKNTQIASLSSDKKLSTEREKIPSTKKAEGELVALKKQNINDETHIYNSTLPSQIEKKPSIDNNEIISIPLDDTSQETDPLMVNQTSKIAQIEVTIRPLLISNFDPIVRPTILPYLYPSIIASHQKSKPFFIDVRTMAGWSIYEYKSFNEENTALANQRKTNERPLEHLGGKLSVGKSFKHQWYASVGLSYSRLNEKWRSSRYDTSEIVLQNQVLESYTNHLGQKVENIGNKKAKQVSEITQTRYNNVEQVGATLSLGKYFNIYKMRWAIEANLSIPTYSRFSGQVLDTTGQTVDLKAVYTPFNNIQYGMHTSYIYPVSGNLAIYGGYDYNFSRLRSDLGYFRTHHLHSLSLGMKYFINK